MRLHEFKGAIKMSNTEETKSPNTPPPTTTATTRQQQMDRKKPNSRPIANGKINSRERAAQIVSQKTNAGQQQSPAAAEIKRKRSVSTVEKISPVQKLKAVSSTPANGRSPIQLRKVKSEANRVSSGDETLLRKAKSVSIRPVFEQSDDGKVPNSLQIVISKPASSMQLEGVDTTPVEEIKEIPDEIKTTESHQHCKEAEVCEEKVIARRLDDLDQELGEEKDEVEIEIEIEKKQLVVAVQEMSLAEEQQSPNKTVKKQENKNQNSEEQTPIFKKQTPLVVNDVKIHANLRKTPKSEEFQGIPRRHGKLQSIVDLVMWKDVSRSALVFGIGTFFIISSSYTQDINISLISLVSHLSLFYLAATFLLRSLVFRGDNKGMATSKQDYQVVGEEEAVWLVKLMLPYLNEFLLNVKALFSGDPATTMKMAVVLFVLARCGSTITIWKLAKLGFFGVFMVPKVCSSYSKQITAYASFWIQRFKDVWESCSHKKAVAFGVFTLVWNLSSFVARIWAAFMLFVAFKYYQQCILIEGAVESRAEESSWQQQTEKPRKERHFVRLKESRKQKKEF